MGTWGEDPTNSDDFGGLWDGMEAAVDKQVAKIMKARKPDPHDRWARVGVLMRLAGIDEGNLFNVRLDYFEQGIVDVEHLMNDEEWISSWVKKSRILDELAVVHSALAAHVKHLRRRR